MSLHNREKERQFLTDRQNILVSVIMANYNTPIEYLKESINSILNQTHSNFELLIIDDGSTDDSLKYIENILLFDLCIHKNTL